jgi:hypothetical protein
MMNTLSQRRFVEYASYVVADSDFDPHIAIWRANAGKRSASRSITHCTDCPRVCSDFVAPLKNAPEGQKRFPISAISYQSYQ